MNRYTKAMRRGVAILLACLSVIVAYGQEYKAAAWLEDFTQLKKELAAHYANLDWSVNVRKMDLKQLSEKTEARLRGAGTDADAKRTIESFLYAFGDGHLAIQWPPAKSAIATSTQLSICQQMGFQKQEQPPRVDFTLLANYRELKTEDTKYFTIGLLQMEGGKQVGVIRIPVFSEYAFPELCELATAEMRRTNDTLCNEACKDQVSQKAANLLTAALVRQIEVLTQNKLDLLLVDITANGGGTNWIEPAARTLTTKALQSPRQQFIRHQHWASQLQQRLAVINTDMKKETGTYREQLKGAAHILQAAVAASQKTCDRNSVWENEKPVCNILVDTPALYPQSVLSYAKPGSLPNRPSSQYLFYPSRYTYKEGVYAGALIVLVDADTWSSAEYFAAMLSDNSAALIMGLPTGGAGCGYTNGGIPTILKNSGAKVKIPDCTRLRANSSNEVAGITPDVLIPWRPNDSRYQRVQRVAEGLKDLLNDNPLR